MRIAALTATVVLLPLLLPAQDAHLQDLLLRRSGSPTIAIPEFRGSGTANPLMKIFNDTVTAGILRSKAYNLASRALFPLNVPQHPADLHKPNPPRGLALADWSERPVNASYLAIGYAAIVQEKLVVYTWVYDLKAADESRTELWGKRYVASPDEEGARDAARRFVTDLVR